MAVRETIDFIVERFPHLTREEAYMIASVAVDYHCNSSGERYKRDPRNDSQGDFCLALTAAFLSQLLTSVVVHAGRTFTAEVLQFNLSQPVARVIIGCEQMTLLEQAT